MSFSQTVDDNAQNNPEEPLQKLTERLWRAVERLAEYIFSNSSRWRPLNLYVLFYAVLAFALALTVMTELIGRGVGLILDAAVRQMIGWNMTRGPQQRGFEWSLGAIVLSLISIGACYAAANLYTRFGKSADYVRINS